MTTNIFKQMSVNHGYIFDDSSGLCEKIFSGLEFISNTYYERPPLKKSDDIVAKTSVLFGKGKNKTVKLGFYLRAHHTKNKIIYRIESAFFKLDNKYYVINDFRKSSFDASNECYFYVSVYDSESKKFARLVKENPNRPVVPDDFKSFDGTDFIIPMNEAAAVRFNPSQEMDVITYAMHLINKEYEKLPKFSQGDKKMETVQSDIVTKISNQCNLDDDSKLILNAIFGEASVMNKNLESVICSIKNNEETYAEIRFKSDTDKNEPSIILNFAQKTETSTSRILMLFKYNGCYYLLHVGNISGNQYYCYTNKFSEVVSTLVDKDIGYEIIDLDKFSSLFRPVVNIYSEFGLSGNQIKNIFQSAINVSETVGVRPRTRITEHKN